MNQRDGKLIRIKQNAPDRKRPAPATPRQLMPEPQDVQASSVDRWSSRLSNWAQVAMLLLVTFGYFYTVKPVYQKELLEEESARLQIEKAEIERTNQKSLAQASELRRDLDQLNERRAFLTAENAALSGQKNDLALELRNLRHEASLKSTQLLAISALSSAQRDQIVVGQKTILSAQASFRWFRKLVGLGTEDRLVFLEGDKVKVEKWAHAPAPIQPYQAVLTAIDEELMNKTYFGLPEPHAVSEQLIIELRNNVANHQEELSCPVLDRVEWQKAWLETQRLYETTIPACIGMHMAHIAQVEGWSAAQLAMYRKGRQGKQDERSFRISCETLDDFYANDQFNKAIQKYYEACSNLFYYADDIANGVKKVEPFPTVTPPKPNMEWYSGWYEKKSTN